MHSSLPVRLEELVSALGPNRLSRVLLPQPSDLLGLEAAFAQANAVGQGKLIFLLGAPGSGKTSFLEGLGLFRPHLAVTTIAPPVFDFIDIPGPMFRGDVPVSVFGFKPGPQISRWFTEGLSYLASSTPSRVMSLAGLEKGAGDQAVAEEVLVAVNAALRRTPGVLVVVPVVRESFAQIMAARLSGLGVNSSLANPSIHRLVGLDRKHYCEALRLLISALGMRWVDLEMSEEAIEAIAAEAPTVGDFLQHLNERSGAISLLFE